MSQNVNKKKADLKELLKKGYIEMGEINLSLSQSSVKSDNEALEVYEEKLTECE